jgi:hypothetical protein
MKAPALAGQKGEPHHLLGPPVGPLDGPRWDTCCALPLVGWAPRQPRCHTLDRPGHRDLGFACTPACVMMRALPLSGSLHRFMYMYVQKLHESTLEIHANLDVDCPFSLKFCCLFVLPLITQIFPAASCSAGRVWGVRRSTRREALQQNGGGGRLICSILYERMCRLTCLSLT